MVKSDFLKGTGCLTRVRTPLASTIQLFGAMSARNELTQVVSTVY